MRYYITLYRVQTTVRVIEADDLRQAMAAATVGCQVDDYDWADDPSGPQVDRLTTQSNPQNAPAPIVIEASVSPTFQPLTPAGTSKRTRKSKIGSTKESKPTQLVSEELTLPLEISVAIAEQSKRLDRPYAAVESAIREAASAFRLSFREVLEKDSNWTGLLR